MSEYSLRWYQQEAEESIYHYFADGGKGNPIVAMPTGTGKSIVIGSFARKVLQAWPGQRILMLTHVKELIEQNAEKLSSIWPTAPMGIYSAGLRRRDTQNPIVFGGVQSVVKEIERAENTRGLHPSLKHFGHRDLVLVDECHLIGNAESSQYNKTLSALRSINPAIKVVGFTATPYRLGSGHLIDEDSLFDDVCYDLTTPRSFTRLIDEGFLSPLIPKRTNTQIDVSGVQISSNGDFNRKQLEATVDKEEITYKCVKEICELGYDRKAWLVFTAGIEHAEHVASMLQMFGIDAAASHSKLSRAENDRILADYKAGRLRCLVNADKYTTGFDYAAIDLIAMLRHTVSVALWVQMLGRGTRPHPYKDNCLVLDFAGNTKRLGPINDPVLPKKRGKGGGGEAPIRVCEVCGVYNHASARVCIGCGSEFQFQSKLTPTAGSDELIRVEEETVVEYFDVMKAVYSKHRKRNSTNPPTLKVSYFCSGFKTFNEYICIEHEGFPKRKAANWWLERDPGPIPATVDEALSKTNALRTPARVRVWTNKKYPEILSYEY